MVKNVLQEETTGKPAKNVTAEKSSNNKSIGLQKAKALRRVASHKETERFSMKRDSAKRQTAREKSSPGYQSRKINTVINRIKKKYSQSHASCGVTFKLPKAAVGSAKRVTIVGDFNNWDAEATPHVKARKR